MPPPRFLILLRWAGGYNPVGLAAEGISVSEAEMVTSNPRASPALIPVAQFRAANGYLTGQTINVNGGW